MLFAGMALAVTHEVRFEWNANPEADMAEYVLHQGTANGGPYTPVLTIPHPQTTTLYSVAGNYSQKFYFVLSAVDTSDNESGYSNQVEYTLPAPPDVTPPGSPSGFKVFFQRIIQAIMDWFRGGLKIS